MSEGGAGAGPPGGAGSPVTARLLADVWSAGQGVGSVDAILPAREVVARLAREYMEARRALCARRPEEP